MLKDIVSVNPIGGHRLHLCFEDGVEGVVDLGSVIRFRESLPPTTLYPANASSARPGATEFKPLE